MSDYISREAAIKALCDASPHSCDFETCGFACQEGETLKAIPAADVRPVKRGKWIETDERNFEGMWYVCSNCGADTKYSQQTNFCPNCGAEMEEQT